MLLFFCSCMAPTSTESWKESLRFGLKMRVKAPQFRRSSITDISNTIADVPSKSGFPKVPVLTHIVAEYAGCSIVEALQLLEP
jgi:hypothetical protein